MNQTASAPLEPISTTKRQPSRPNGVSGTSIQARNATTGIALNCTTWLKAKARPRTRLGTSSAM